MGKTSARSWTNLPARFSSKSRRAAKSGCRRRSHAALALGREGEAGEDVLVRERGKIGPNFSFGHAAREVPEDVIRVPRTQGFPKRTSGAIEMWLA